MEKYKGNVGKLFLFVVLDNCNVLIKVLKKVEEIDEYVVCVYEIEGWKV